MAQVQPGCWKEVDRLRAMRGTELPNWPPWCFLPLAGSYAIVSRGERLAPEEAGRVAAFGALAAWRATQGVYVVHPTVRAAIEETPLAGDLPAGVLHRLPEWCIYVAAPGMRFLSGTAEGFFAYLEWDANTGREELRLVVDSPPLLNGMVPIHLGGSLEAGLESAKAEARRQAGRARLARVAEDIPAAGELATLLAPMVNLVLYICAENADIRDAAGRRDKPGNPRPVKTKGGPRTFPADHPTTWDVGSRLGAALDSAAASPGEPQGGTHASPRPHIRRAHWHHFWTGPRGAQEVSLRWLPPIPVNVDETRSVVPTIRTLDPK